MARVKLSMAGVDFCFRTEMEVRITDINYGRHMGNDALLGLLHEARLRFLAAVGFSEEDIGGVPTSGRVGMLMGDAVLQYKAVAVRGDTLVVEIGLADVERRTFDLMYRVTRPADGATIALAKTGMVAFDYTANRPVNLPDVFVEKMGAKA